MPWNNFRGFFFWRFVMHGGQDFAYGATFLLAFFEVILDFCIPFFKA